MRIISPFKDYYDGVQRQGYDAQHPYVRKTEIIEIKGHKETLPFGAYVNGYRGWHREKFQINSTSVIIVAGKPFLRKEMEYVRLDIFNNAIRTTEAYFSADSLEKKIRECVPEYDLRKKTRYTQEYHLSEDVKELRNFPQPKHFTEATNLCLNYKAPIIEIRHDDPKTGYNPRLDVRGYVILNPQLNMRGFAHAMDPFTIYQELAMYISGVLGAPANPTVDITEKTMVKKKGFDPKYGFRKRPV